MIGLEARLFFSLALGLLLVGNLVSAGPKYVFWGVDPVGGPRQDHPEDFSPAFFEATRARFEVPDNPDLKLGLTFIFSIMEGSPEKLAESLRQVCASSEETGIPILLTLESQNWWTTRPELWNWWDPALPGYDPANAENVEWTSWDPKDAVKISWRNWGMQIRIKPAQNLFARRVMAEVFARLKLLVPVLAEWYKSLPADQKWLFRGVKLGSEACIGGNAFYYPGGNSYLERWPDDASHDPAWWPRHEEGLSSGAAQIGYAALASSGLKTSGEITRDDLARLIQLYVEVLCRKTHSLGLPTELITTHLGGTHQPYELHMPLWPAFNQWADTVGYSMYWMDPASFSDFGEQLASHQNDKWAACEWYWGAPDAESWCRSFERTLGFADCQFLCIYPLDKSEFQPGAGGWEGLKQFFATWRPPAR